MRVLHVFIVTVLFLFINYVCNKSSPSPFSPLFSFSSPCLFEIDHKFMYLCQQNDISKRNFSLTVQDIPKILILLLGLILITSLLYLQLCIHVRYVTFNTNLNLCIKQHKYELASPQSIMVCVSLILCGLCLTEVPDFFPFLWLTCPDYGQLVHLSLKLHKILSRILFFTSSLCMFYLATSPTGNILCIVILQITCYSFKRNIPQWLPFLLIKLSNDVHLNPGPPFQNNYFTFMSWNLNSLSKDNFQRVRLIEAHNSLFNYDIISICETGLNDSIELPDSLLDDYTFVSSNNPANTRHGGVGLFFKNSLPVKVRNDLSFDESIVVELRFGRKKIFFTTLYRSPAFNHTSCEFLDFLSNFENLNAKIKAENPFASFFTGDFNGHSQLWWPDGDTNPEGMEIENLLTSLNLSQLISEPTNFEPHKNPSCIDLIITDQPNLVLNSGTRPSLDSFCHHQITHCKVNFKIPPPPPFERTIWHFNRANSAAIKRSMSSFPWLEHLNMNTDPNWQVKSFTNIFLNIMSNFIPNEVKKIVPRDPPWITKPLKTLLNKKNRLFKNYKRHGFKAEDKVRLDAFRVECQQAVETAKSSYLTNLGNKLHSPNTPQKSYWKIISRVMNKSRAPKIPPLLVNNLFILNCKDKAKHFTEFFSQQCKPIINGSILPTLTYLTDKRIDHIAIEYDEIISLVRKINPNKATGSDGISGHMLLICDESVILPLQIIFRNILSTSIYPDMWKLANVTPIFKKGDKQLIKNYRPISLLPICGKIFEKIIFNKLYNYLHSNNLITKNQSGFRPGDSTTNQLLYLLDEIHQAFDNIESYEVRAVFLDISKAFDKVWHDGLIFKLEQNGVTGSLLLLFKDYLSNRNQRVVLNGSYSNYSSIESGVPQGSVLGPLLFLIYINDLEKNIKSNIKFFADDTMLFSVVKNPVISANDLNHDLNIIHQWAYQWKMEFNPDPTKQATEVLFSCKKTNTNHPQILFNGTVVEKVQEQKHLGLTLHSNLSFEKHLNEKIIKAKKNVGIIKHISKFLPLKTLDQMYKALVRSHLDYCDIIYHSPSLQNQPSLGPTLNSIMEKVERIQYQAALAVTGAWQGSNRTKLYEELGWETLSDRRWCRRILQIHKIVSDKTPSYLKDKLPPNRRPLYGSNTYNTFHEIRCKSLRYMNSFFPDAISSWNIIITHFDNVPSIGILKDHILSLIRPKNMSIFGIHDPLGLRYLFQLRVGLSSLRYHKRRHNFSDTLSDKCLCKSGVEDINHFLFSCPFYASKRATLAVCVIEILQKYNLNHLGNQSEVYLYGHRLLNSVDNKNILLATIKYIKETRRFST